MSIGVSNAPPTNKQAAATNTIDVRRAWMRDLNRRFRRLRGLVRQTIGYERDAANLSGGPQTGQVEESPGTGDAEPVEAFPTFTQGALTAAFAAWFANAARRTVLDPRPPAQVRQGAHWTAPFVNTAFTRGVNQSTGLLYQAGVGVENIPDDEITDHAAFQRPLRRRYYSPFSELDGITDDMADEMSAILQQATDEGWSPRRAADAMTEELRSIERDRAYTIARTETAFTASQASVENYRRAGVEGVSHVGRMITPDESLCAFCRALADETFTLQEFTGVRALFRGQRYFIGVPAHPSCRCAPIPKPGLSADDLPPLEDRVPGRIIARGFDMFTGQRSGAAWD